jgi:hypothetical protein
MLLFAATALEKMQALPMKAWINLALAVLILFTAVVVFRKAAEINKVVLGVIIFVIVTSLGFHWIYHRNEPKFLTPLIEPMARFLPTAGKQAEKTKRPVPPQPPR